MALVLCYELLFGEGLKPHGPAERVVLAAEESLKAAAKSQMEALGISKIKDLAAAKASEPIPRAVRINLLKWSVKDALKHLHNPKNPGCQAVLQVRLRTNALHHSSTAGHDFPSLRKTISG